MVPDALIASSRASVIVLVESKLVPRMVTTNNNISPHISADAMRGCTFTIPYISSHSQRIHRVCYEEDDVGNRVHSVFAAFRVRMVSGTTV